MNRELQQRIRSIHRGEDPDDRRILVVPAAMAATLDPTVDSDWYNLQSEGILHLEAREDGGPGLTTATFRPWFLEPGLSGEPKAGTAFTWNFATATTMTLNVQGKTLIHLQLIGKGNPADEFSLWGGVNTVEGA